MSPTRIILTDQSLAYLLSHADTVFKDRLIEQLKLVRGVTGLGLKEARDLIEEGRRHRRETVFARGNFLHGEHDRHHSG